MISLVELSDLEIKEIAEPIRRDVIDGSNSQNWALHSRNMPSNIIENEHIQRDVEKQWREDESAASPRTSLARESLYMGIIRKKKTVSIIWKQTSTKSDEEYLLSIVLKEIDGEIKQVGATLD